MIMKRGIFFAYLSAIVVGLTVMVLVITAFTKPQIFQRIHFIQKVSGLRLVSKSSAKSNAEIVSQATQAVVTVVATRAIRANQPTTASDWSSPPENNVQRGTGTGFIIGSEGLIVTNEHVIKDADRIRIKLLDGRERKATVQGVDHATDLALLKIDASQLPVLNFGDSDAAQVGDPVIAIGNPLEYEHTVTAGIISAKGRKVYGYASVPFEDFIQTDAAINRGNSGGPLLNRAGEVIGVNTVIRVDGRGISFAVPGNIVKHVISQLRSAGFVARGYLGVTPANITSEFREGLGLGNVQGVLVTEVMPNFPAARAGIQPYDVITHIDRHAIQRTDDFFTLVANTPPQRKVELAVMRGAQQLKFYPTLDVPPSAVNNRAVENQPKLQRTGFSLGFSVRENTPEILRELRVDKLNEGINGGVVVSEVDPLGPAADSRLSVGHIILEVNRHPIRNLEDFQRLTSQLRNGSAIVLRITTANRRDQRLLAIRVGDL